MSLTRVLLGLQRTEGSVYECSSHRLPWGLVSSLGAAWKGRNPENKDGEGRWCGQAGGAFSATEKFQTWGVLYLPSPAGSEDAGFAGEKPLEDLEHLRREVQQVMVKLCGGFCVFIPLWKQILFSSILGMVLG